MKYLHGLLILLIAGIAFANTAESQQTFTLYLVRHAEKQMDGSRDPLLNEAGRLRAEKLSLWFQDKQISKTWSTDYHRTRDTARPFLLSQGGELNLYDPRQLQLFAERLLQEQVNALVVGHSNTTPELARMLCKCDIEPMDESEYDRLISIEINDQEAAVTTLHQASLLK